ncbi:MAG: endonuclease/exonuclease/phosphatase family protein [Planctomycetes bacterium]|nr:endonuclease/exonuclease/phosphatase family protein [Planctomycetota bacterium]
MRNLPLALALALLALAGCAGEPVPLRAPPAAPSGEFTTLSYNVAGLPQEISKVRPKEHIPLIGPLLNGYDIVLTQEDFDWWRPGLDKFDFAHYHARLRAAADHPWSSGRHPGPQAVGLHAPTQRPSLMVGDGLGLLSRFPFDDFRRVPWRTFGEGGADGLAMKGFAMARVGVAEGVTVDVYTLHADAGAAPADDAARRAGFEQLAAWMEERSAGRAVILGGDTNLHTRPESADARIWSAFLVRTGLTDVCDTLDSGDRTRIDKFAFRAGDGVDLRPVSEAFESERFRDADGNPLSDHEALAVRWRWKLLVDELSPAVK